MKEVNTCTSVNTSKFKAPALRPPMISGDLAVIGGLKAVQRLAEQIVEAALDAGCDSRDAFHTRLALEEALANAVKHGNRHDSKKAVYVKYEVDAVGMRATIRDEGKGFDQSSIPNPTEDAHLQRPNGRGLFLMGQFMDSVEYNASGNCVTLTRKWTGQEQ